MARILYVLCLAAVANFCLAQEQLELADSAPRRHSVVAGDTLWDLAGRYLKEPWRWPELWRMNRESIRNPAKIYPGDVIVLERDDKGTPYLRVESEKLEPRIYAAPNAQPIPPIAPNVIEPFIASPLVIEADGFETAAKIVATPQDRVFLGNGDLAYVDKADPGVALWQVYRNGRPLIDPEDPKKVLGFEAFHLGTAKQIRPGSPATFQIQTVRQEIGRGDYLLPATKPRLVDYVPHRPETLLEGRIISIYGGIGSAGRGSIVSLNRGSRDGVEIGHVLALERNRIVFERDEKGRKVSAQIPHERIGLIFVFRTFERISYALVLQSEGTVDVNDFVRTP